MGFGAWMFLFLVITAIVGSVLLIVYYKDKNEDKNNALLIAGWVLLGPSLLAVALGLVVVYFTRVPGIRV
jgi:hypothetical protein